MLSFSLIFIVQVNAQTSANWEEAGFITHVLRNNDFENTIWLCDKLLTKTGDDKTLRDSLLFMKAWSYYNLKKLDSAAFFFSQVDTFIESYAKAKFFGCICMAYEKNYYAAKEFLASPFLEKENEIRLKPFLLSGIFLLERNFKSYNELRSTLDTNWFPVSVEIKKLDKYANLLSSYKEKKKINAAILSAIIPGLGKVYAGRPGDGASAFLITSSLGLVSYENFRKDGWKDIKTLFFSGLFLTYYLGNIIGSYYSVNLERYEFYEQIDYNILFDLHIPVRTVYF